MMFEASKGHMPTGVCDVKPMERREV